MKRMLSILLLIVSSIFSVNSSKAQGIAPANLKVLRLMDDSLGKYGAQILDDVMPGDRLEADSIFTRVLVRALKVPYSFYFPFDSMVTAPVVYPDDSSFRIITWHYTLNDADYHQRGVLQMNTPDGSIKIFPLYDFSDNTDAPEDSVRTPKNWIGAVYYKIVQQKNMDGSPVYTLLGYDENNLETTRKWMEILSFNRNGEPRFGGSFTVAGENGRPKIQQRYLMEYKKGASAKLNYDAEEGIIMMDHLQSETNQPNLKSTMVPSGDYEAFKWQNGNWINDPKLFTQMLGDGNEPRPATILNDNGVPDESKLIRQSEKNINKSKPVKKDK